MKISIIVPTYKPQEYIWECLDSIKKQTFSPEDFEVILVLNGCDEPYHSQIKNYINQNFTEYNINFIQTDIGGVSNARNLALDVAIGEYITFLDDDDFISPQYLEELYRQASPNTVSLCYPYAFNDGKPDIQLQYGLTKVYNKYHKRPNNTINSKVRKYFSGPCMKLLHRGIIGDRRFDIRFKNGEDSIFMFHISDKMSHVEFTSEKAIYYRRYRDGSAIMSKRSLIQKATNTAKIIGVLLKIYSRHPASYSISFLGTRILGCIKSIISTS